MTIQENLKELQTEMERKVHEIKSFHETEKQEIRRQHSRMYQDLLDETNQVRFPLITLEPFNGLFSV